MNPETQEHPQVLVVGPDGIATSAGEQGENASREKPVTEMVEQPAKVMRIGNMIRQLLEEVRAAPLDEKSRARLKEIHQSSIKELEDGLAPELVDELERLSGRPVPRHPDDAVRPADGGPRPARADAPRPAARDDPPGSGSTTASHVRPVPLRPFFLNGRWCLRQENIDRPRGKRHPRQHRARRVRRTDGT